MKVLLINGSPHENGCTATALAEVAFALGKHQIDTETVYLGLKPVAGCIACHACRKTGKCFVHDKVNEVLEMMPEIDGIVVGSPVYYAGPSGQLCAFLDRLFYAGDPALFVNKPGAAVVSCRRGGASAAFDRLNKYFTITNMPVVSSQYWNQVHGNTTQEVRQDEEGMQTMRTLGNNMAWMLKCIAAGRAAGVKDPESEPAIRTNFIR